MSDRESSIAEINNAACELFGFTQGAADGNHIYDIDTINSKNDYEQIFSRLSQNKILRFSTILKKNDGSTLEAEFICHYIEENSKDYMLCYIYPAEDMRAVNKKLLQKTEELKKLNENLEKIVSERTKDLNEKISALEKTEKRLRASERLFINAFQTSKDSININRLSDGKYISINKGFTGILGYTEEDVLGRTSLELNIWKNPEDRENLVNSLKETGIVHDFEAEFYHKDGHVINGLMSASIQEINGEKVILSVSKEITKIKSLENSLKELNENLMQRVKEEVALRQKQEAKLFEQRKLADMGEMINAIAHQWRQPLNNISLISQIMQDVYEGEEQNVSFAELVETHNKLVQHMSDTIDDFRDFFHDKNNVVEFSLVKELLNTVSLVRAQFEAESINIKISCGCCRKMDICKGELISSYCAKEKDLIKGNPNELRQVFLNILSNAKDAVTESAKVIPDMKKEIIIDISKDSGNIRIDMQNKGRQIPQDILSKIFNPYFTTKQEGKGVGIGLYMSRIIIQEHMNGTISCRNLKDGVSFEMTFKKIR